MKTLEYPSRRRRLIKVARQRETIDRWISTLERRSGMQSRRVVVIPLASEKDAFREPFTDMRALIGQQRAQREWRREVLEVAALARLAAGVMVENLNPEATGC